ncbi:MAG: LysR family transcriptional regulator [Bacteroidota bacterium]
MDTRLKVFKAVADQLSYTRAARVMKISQPAVSKHIAKLEAQFGKALINREGGRISLTPEGELLLSYANRILDLYKTLEQDFLALDDQFPPHLVMGASTTISQYILPKDLSELKKLYPSLEITLINGNTEKIEQLVLDKQIDLGFTEGKSVNPYLHYESYRADEIVLATRVSSQLRKKDEVRFEELKKLPMIIREPGSGTRKVIESALSQKGIEPDDLNVEMVLGSTEGIKSYLLNTEAYAFLSIHAILDELKTNQLRIIEVKKLDIKRHFQYVYLHGHATHPIKMIQKIFSQRHN